MLASLDPIGAMADAEALALESLLADLEPADADLRRFIGKLADAHDIELLHRGLVDPDDVAELPAEATVRPGDLYVLGDHRLLCGDATDAEHVRRAFGDASEADLMWTDPPYGVAYQTKLSTEEAVARHRRTDGLEILNDEPDDIPALLRAAFTNAPLKPGGSFYVASPSSGDVLPVFYATLAEAGMPVRQQLVWVKAICTIVGGERPVYRAKRTRRPLGSPALSVAVDRRRGMPLGRGDDQDGGR